LLYPSNFNGINTFSTSSSSYLSYSSSSIVHPHPLYKVNTVDPDAVLMAKLTLPPINHQDQYYKSQYQAMKELILATMDYKGIMMISICIVVVYVMIMTFFVGDDDDSYDDVYVDEDDDDSYDDVYVVDDYDDDDLVVIHHDYVVSSYGSEQRYF
jgi:hypothetical protein